MLSAMRGVVIVGAGPAGLMAAETLGQAGVAVLVVDANPKPGRKFLVAGRSGLNLTHSEPIKRFASRYGENCVRFTQYLEAFSPTGLRAWADGLGAETFIGTSGRVFPRMFKGANLLAAWQDRLKSLNVRLRGRLRLRDIAPGPVLTCQDADGDQVFEPKAVILALGGASWPETGSDGQWTQVLAARGVPLTPWQPANVALNVAWPESVLPFAGEPLKTIALSAGDGQWLRGELVVSTTGVEGGGVYSVSRSLRDGVARDGVAHLHLDLKPDLLLQTLRDRAADLSTTDFARRLRLSPLAEALLAAYAGADRIAALKDLVLPITGTRPLAEAISSAGGIPFAACDEGLQLLQIPGVWVCGEMLDWEAPTGGYLLQGCASTAVWAAQAILKSFGLPAATPALHSPQPLPGISR